jgi:hypothetical protein
MERMGSYMLNWLRVLDTTERPQIDQGIGHQLHPIVSLLDEFKAEQQPLAFVLPRKGPLDTGSSGRDRCIEAAFASALGRLAMARMLCDVRAHAGIEDHLPLGRGIKPAIAFDRGASEIHADLFGHLLHGVQALRQQDHSRLIDTTQTDRERSRNIIRITEVRDRRGDGCR